MMGGIHERAPSSHTSSDRLLGGSYRMCDEPIVPGRVGDMTVEVLHEPAPGFQGQELSPSADPQHAPSRCHPPPNDIVLEPIPSPIRGVSSLRRRRGGDRWPDVRSAGQAQCFRALQGFHQQYRLRPPGDDRTGAVRSPLDEHEVYAATNLSSAPGALESL